MPLLSLTGQRGYDYQLFSHCPTDTGIPVSSPRGWRKLAPPFRKQFVMPRSSNERLLAMSLGVASFNFSQCFTLTSKYKQIWSIIACSLCWFSALDMQSVPKYKKLMLRVTVWLVHLCAGLYGSEFTLLSPLLSAFNKSTGLYIQVRKQ